MMTLHKLHAGDGYTYLTRQVAAGDEGRSPGQQLVDYYTASGNPPGRWIGSGAAALGVTGRVREDQMRSLFGRGLHPDADQILALELAAGTDQTEAARAVKLGRAFPRYRDLPPRADRVQERVAAWTAEHGHPPSPVVRSKVEAQEARRERRAVAGYDLVFTPVKSASLLWALGSAGTRQAVEDAHHAAVADTLAWLEAETAFARVGDHGEQQIDTRGFIAAAFDHRDSRAGDPDLHTHLAISNKVRARHDSPDGTARWLSLDARTLHAAAVAASERYNTRFEDALTHRLGVTFTDRADTIRNDKRVVREITGIPDELIRHFSKRRTAVEDRYRALAADYRTRHDQEPSTATQLKLAQQATLETRNGKPPPRSLAEKLIGWAAEAGDVLGQHPVATLEAAALGRPFTAVSPSQLDLDELAVEAVAVVAAEKATWTRWNLIAETERRLRHLRFATPADRQAATDAVIDRALHPQVAVRLTSDGLDASEVADAAEPVVRRSSGESVLVEHGSARYTTQDLLDAEHRLLSYASQTTRHGLAPATARGLIEAFEDRNGVALDPGQRALVVGFTTDTRRLVIGIGPAGAGKTTAMRAVADLWASTGRRVVPLAPSASAADVLGIELGCRAENLHKFRHAHEHGNAHESVPVDPWFTLQPGDLVLIDEAGMAGTRTLDWVTHHARERGALVRMLGDPAQLTAVEAGGSLRLLVHDVGAVELTDLHRFTDPDEAAATIGLREGRPDALHYYRAHDRISAGTPETMLDAAYRAWATDISIGRTSLLIAGSTRQVIALNARARADRVAAGHVETTGVYLRDGTWAGVGDEIVTRKNQRHLTGRDGTRFVKNGDTWTVHQRHRNGDLTVRGPNGFTVRLPDEYVREHVELGYATTTARAQGRTVDTAHVLIDETTNREALYVGATRGRQTTRLYVQAEHLLDIGAERPPTPSRDATDILTAILRRAAAEVSATEVARRSPRSIKARPQPPTPRAPSQPVAPRTKIQSATAVGAV
jgi:conjugative relaxase-like TrwC/TraI family protein